MAQNTIADLGLQSGQCENCKEYEFIGKKSDKKAEFKRANFQFSPTPNIPNENWRPLELPNQFLLRAWKSPIQSRNYAWVKLEFESGDFDASPIAITTDYSRGLYQIYFNGIDIYRNHGVEKPNIYFWNKPMFIQLPNSIRKNGKNIVHFRIQPTNSGQQGVGIVRISNFENMKTLYEQRMFLDISAPKVINGIVLALSFALGALWFARKRELGIGYMALIGFIWSFQMWRYYTETPIFAPAILTEGSLIANYWLLLGVFAYAARFMNLPKISQYIKITFGAIIFVSLLHIVLLALNFRTRYCYLFLVIMFPILLFPLIREVVVRPKLENISLVGAIVFLLATSIHDFGMIASFWAGLKFFTQPFAALVIFAVFGFTLGARVLGAFNTVENLNVMLEEHAQLATKNLKVSESARRELEVKVAIETERERIMSEIHDRIGSSLVTSLATAKRSNAQAAGEVAVKALKRAINDLKIAVDSLDAIDGDVIALLANFRHRLEPDLLDAGIEIKWQVSKVPPLKWLDAIAALHVLRIMQEAISNTISYSQANEIIVGCETHIHADKDGILISIADNGKGFDFDNIKIGRGIGNMKSRANSIGGMLSIESDSVSGTKINCWLPLIH